MYTCRDFLFLLLLSFGIFSSMAEVAGKERTGERRVGKTITALTGTARQV